MSLIDRLRLARLKTISKLDDPATTQLHAQIIRGKLFLKRLYVEWYEILRGAIRSMSPGRRVIELGSGGGFIKE